MSSASSVSASAADVAALRALPAGLVAVSPLTMTLIAWPLVSERPRTAHLSGAVVGLAGVCLMLDRGSDRAAQST
ncbi:hypothetical protein [Streptomyces sp. OE57]|uniref:hypothetical protein n=1 Tax=Streptomyces lacaronensis TaxID=3379885 RepID=UPI0039B753F1